MAQEKQNEGRGRRVQSVEVGAGLLLALADAAGPLTLTELAAAVEMAPAKAHRYLASYIQCGLVDHRHGGRYDLGPAAARIGVAACARIDSVSRVSDRLDEICALTKATAMLNVWSDRGPVVLRCERDYAQASGLIGPGFLLPLTLSSTGIVFLSWLPRRVTAAKLAEERAGREGEPNEETVARMIAETRARGYVESVIKSVQPIYSLAGPVLSASGEAEAALTLISHDPALLSDERAIEIVREGAGTQRGMRRG